MKRNFLLLIAALFCTAQAFAWGQKGHDVTAFIAENHLTDNAKSKIVAALDGHSLVYYANWLDNASNTQEYRYTKTWHYKNWTLTKPTKTLSWLPLAMWWWH